jgi:hypothetical protein
MIDPTDTALLSAVPSVAPHVTAAVFEAESVLYDAVSARPVLLNVSASAVWAAIDATSTIAEIASTIAADFGLRAADVLPDVMATIVRFVDLDLVVLVPAAGP